MSASTRPAAVAGFFYPADAAALASAVDALLSHVTRGADAAVPRARAFVVPHAGYVYSGPVAAHAYAQVAALRGRVDRVVLLGPSHRAWLQGMALPGVDAFETPLGLVPVDADLVRSVSTLHGVVTWPEAHAREHSLEVQLPFLQRALGNTFTLLPLSVGDARPEDVARVLETCADDRTLLLVSTDLSHQLPYAAAQRVDADTLEQVNHGTFTVDTDRACGAVPLAGLVHFAREHGLRARVLDARNSGDTAGTRDHVVGYAAVAWESA